MRMCCRFFRLGDANYPYNEGMYCYLTAKTVGIVELFPKSYKNTRTRSANESISASYLLYADDLT